MKTFNSLQMVLMFAAWPYLIQYLKDAKFYGHTAAFWGSIIIYAIGFIMMIIAVRSTIEDGEEYGKR